jgi:hypothetical protein
MHKLLYLTSQNSKVPSAKQQWHLNDEAEAQEMQNALLILH